MRKFVIGVAIIALLSLFNIYHRPIVPEVPKVDPDIVHVAIPTKNNQQVASGEKVVFNPFSKTDVMQINLKTHTFYIYAISLDVASHFEKFSTLMMNNGVKEITINLHSPGGELEAAQIIEEQVGILKEHGIKINTIVESKNACMSACPIIFLTGDSRIASEDSVFMFHAPYIQYPHNASQAEVRFVEKDLAKSRTEFANRLAKVCPGNEDVAKMLIFDHEDHFFKALVLQAGCSKIFTSVKLTSRSFSDAVKSLNTPGGRM